MNIIKGHRFFNIICLALVVTFISLDISYAYPPEHNLSNSTLATPSLLQQQPINEHMVRFQRSVFSQGALLASVYDIGEYFFGRPERKMESLPSKYAEEVVMAGLGKILGDSGIEILNIVPVEYLKTTVPEKLNSALSEIGFKGTLPDEGVVFILYKKDGKKFLVQIAEKAKVSAVNLPGYEWVISDKYVVKYMPESYEEGKLQSSLRGSKATEAISPLDVAKEAPKVTITEPIAKVEVPATKAEKSKGILTRAFNIKAITALTLAIILLFAQTAFTASDNSTSLFSSSNIFWLITGTAALITIRYFAKKRLMLAKAQAIINEIGILIFMMTGFSKVYVVDKPGQAIFSIGTKSGEVPDIWNTALFINTSIIKQRRFMWLWDNHNDLLKQVISVDLYQRVISVDESENIDSSLKMQGYTGRNDPNAKNAYFSEINKRAYSKVGPRGVALEAWFYQIYPDLLYAIKHVNRDWITNEVGRYLAKEYLWMNNRQIEEVINEVFKIDEYFFNPKKSKSVTLKSINPLAAIFIASALGSIFSAAKDFAFAHPIIAGIAALGIGIAAVFTIWRMFFPISWHLFWVRFAKGKSVHIEALIKTGKPAVPYIIKALGYSNNDVRWLAVYILGKIGPVTPEVVPALVKALGDRDSDVRSIVAAALIKINDRRLLLMNDYLMDSITPYGYDKYHEVLKEEEISYILECLNNNVSIKGQYVPHVPHSSKARLIIKMNDGASSATLYSINPFTATFIASALGAIFSAAKGFAFAHPIIAGIAALGICIVAFFTIWRAFLPVSWHLYWLALSDASRRSFSASWYMFWLDLSNASKAALVKIGSPAVPALIVALQHKNSDGRRSAAKVLGDIKDPRAVEPLITALSDSESDVRSTVARALDNICWEPVTNQEQITYLIAAQKWNEVVKIGSPAVPSLIKLLSDSNEYRRQDAAKALDNIGWEPVTDQEQITYLLATEKWDKLAMIGSPAVPSLIKASHGIEFGFNARYDAAKALGNIKDPRAVEPLIKALGDSNYMIRESAAEALGNIYDPRISFMGGYLKAMTYGEKYYVALTEKEIRYIVYCLKNGIDIKAQFVNYEAFHREITVLDFFIDASAPAEFTNAYETVVVSRAKLIIKMDKTILPRGEKQNGPTTLVFVNPFVASFIASVLGAIFSAAKDFASAHPIITVGILLVFGVIAWRIVDGLRRTSFPVEMNLRDLIHKKDPRAEKYFMKAESSVIPALIKAFNRGNPDIRKSIAKILVRRKDRRVTEPFIKPLLKDSDLDVRMTILRELIRAKDPLAIKSLAEILSDMKHAGHALRYLYHMKVRNSILIDPLAKVLSEAPEPHIRKRAISILEDIEDIRVVGLLIKVLKEDKDEGVLYDALCALATIKKSKIMDSIDPAHKSILEFTDEAKSLIAKKVKTYIPGHERHVINARFIYKVVYPILNITKDLTDARFALRLALDLCPSKVTVDAIVREVKSDIYEQDGVDKIIEKRYSYNLTKAIALINNKELLYSKIAEFKTELLQKHILSETSKQEDVRPLPAQISKAAQLFEIVESSLNNKREQFINAGNRLIGSLPAKSVSEIAAKNINALDGNMATTEIRQRVEDVIAAIESSGAEAAAPKVKTAIGLLRKDLNQFEADGAVGSLIVLARRAKRENQKLIIGLETDWIPGINIENSCQRQAIFALMKEIDAIGDALKSMGLDNVEIIRGSGKELADTLLGEAEKTRTNLRNIVVMASSDTINSTNFAVLRNADENDRPFLAGIDPTELIKLYSEFGETISNQLYVRLTQLLCITLELAAGKEPPHTPTIVSYDKKMRIVVFLPKAEPLDYELLKKAYAAEKAALVAA